MAKKLKERPFLPECMGSYQKALYLLIKGKHNHSKTAQKWKRCSKHNNDLEQE